MGSPPSFHPSLPPDMASRPRVDSEDILGRPVLPPEPPGIRPGSSHRRSGLETLARVVRRRLWQLLICVVLVPAVAFAYSATRPKQYTATADLLLRDLNLAQKLFGSSSFSSPNDPQREANTNLKLVALEAVAARTARGVGLPVARVQGMVEVAPDGQSDLIGVLATDGDPKLAARVANAFSHQYIAFRQAADRQQVESAIALVQGELSRLTPGERQGTAGQQLARQVQQLGVLAALQTGNAELVQIAQPPSVPSKPTPKRDAVVGLLAGLLLGLGLAFALEKLDQRLKEAEDVEEAFGLPVLTELPESRTLGSRRRNPVVSEGPEAEAFALLRASLRYFNIERDINSVVVTSPAPLDGKTTVALNLAAAAARAGEDVLLIEADLRRPQLAKRLELPPGPGLSGALSRGGDLRDGIISLELPPVNGGDDRHTTLDLLPAGPVPPNPAQLLESAVMRGLLEETTRLWDLIIIDTPPTSSVPDTIPLMNWASGVLVVCRLGRTRRGAAALVRRQLDSMRATPLGLVLNGARGSHLAYYDYRSEPAAR